uniref:Uncharacterized protein n=1 Tax=Glossina palpalis gambiensis TaxID=67801 RepID=A0A1B0BLJ5_9MUSC
MVNCLAQYFLSLDKESAMLFKDSGSFEDVSPDFEHTGRSLITAAITDLYVTRVDPYILPEDIHHPTLGINLGNLQTMQVLNKTFNIC